MRSIVLAASIGVLAPGALAQQVATFSAVNNERNMVRELEARCASSQVPHERVCAVVIYVDFSKEKYHQYPLLPITDFTRLNDGSIEIGVLESYPGKPLTRVSRSPGDIFRPQPNQGYLVILNKRENNGMVLDTAIFQ